MKFGILLVLIASVSARAAQIPSFAQLEAILGDRIIIEDFEGFSLHAGTSTPAPNPLNSTTAPRYWNLEPGVTYSSSLSLRVYANQLFGDDSNILAGAGGSMNDLTITFDQPQIATGFYLVNITGNLDYNETVTFFRGTDTIASTDLVLPSGQAQFMGWQDAAGITSVRVSSDAFAMVDNVTWGLAVPMDGPPPAPDGSGGTEPLRAERLDAAGESIRVTWDVLSCASNDYNLVYADLSDVGSYAPNGADCLIGTRGDHTWSGVPAGNLYFLIVGADGEGTESSWGRNSAGEERNGSAVSGLCGAIVKYASGTCP